MADIRPAQPLRQGRYHLDRYGRLHAAAPRGTRTVAMVIVRLKQPESDARQVAIPEPAAPRDDLAPSRPMARRAKPTPVYVPEDVLPPPSHEDEVMAEFYAAVRTVRARRAKGAQAKASPKLDGAAIAAAHRAKPVRPAPIKVVQRQALADGECYRCGTRTTVGCAHFLPFRGDVK